MKITGIRASIFATSDSGDKHVSVEITHPGLCGAFGDLLQHVGFDLEAAPDGGKLEDSKLPDEGA